MRISYESKKLEKQLTDAKLLVKTYGELAKNIQKRQNELESFENLGEAKDFLPSLHSLSGDRLGQWAVKISGNYRLIFEPANDPLPCLEDGGLDLNQITEICIIEVVDYH
jgi:plasmid maintenance system killer protein